MLAVLFRSCPAVLKSLCLAAVLALAGCASALTPQIKRLPDRVDLNNVPFFRGNAYQSGPGVLAGMLSNQHVQITPGLLEKPLQLPEGEARLESRMQQVAREYGFMVYPLDDGLQSLLTQVSAGYPVMVRFADGMVWSQPRYGILVGYNRNKQTVLLHAGMNRQQIMSFSSFTSAWEKTGSWAVLIQSPRQLPANLNESRWLKAASDLAQAGQEQAAGEAVKTLKGR